MADQLFEMIENIKALAGPYWSYWPVALGIVVFLVLIVVWLATRKKGPVVPLTLKQLGSQQQIDSRNLERKLDKRELTFLLGACGSGKTTLLHEMEQNLGKTAVLYTVGKSTQSVESMLYYIKEEIKNKKQDRIWILVDGFDQLREIWQGKRGEELIPMILRGIKGWEMPNQDIRLVLTAKKENFSSWPFYDEAVCQAYELLPLSGRQILEIYQRQDKQKFRYSGPYKVPDVYFNKARLKRILSKCGTTPVLSNPFLLTYVDVLLAYVEEDAFGALSVSQAMDLILSKYWMIREYNTYLKAAGQEEEKFAISEYQRWVQTVLLFIISGMLEDLIPVYDMERMPEEYQEYARNRCHIVGYMMNHHKDSYWFEHDLVLEFFAAQYLSNQSCSYQTRYRWIAKTNLMNLGGLYQQALSQSDLLYTKLINSLELSEGENPFELEHLVIKEKPRMFVAQILAYLVQVKTFTWLDMEFTQMDTRMLAEQGIVDLEGRGLKQLSLLNDMGYLRQVYADQNQITTIGAYRYCSMLQVLDVTKNPFVNYEELKELPLQKLLISAPRKEDLDQILEVAGSLKLVLDIPNMSFMYTRIFDLREQEGKDITIRKGIITSKSILLRYLKVFKYTIADLIKIYVMDALHHDSNQRCIPLLQFLYKVMVNKETQRSLERTMIHMLAEMTIFSQIKEPVAWVETLWEEKDQILAQLLGEALIQLHLGAWYHARGEYSKSVKALEASGVIINLSEEFDLEQQQELIPIVCRFVPMEHYYQIYMDANQKAGNQIELVTMEEGEMVLDNIYGELTIKAFQVLKLHDDDEFDLEQALERMF